MNRIKRYGIAYYMIC